MKKHSLVQRVKYKKIYKRYLFICYHTFISYEEHAKSHSNEIEISEKSLKYFSNSPLCMPQKNFLKFTILDPSCNSAPNPPKLVNNNFSCFFSKNVIQSIIPYHHDFFFKF